MKWLPFAILAFALLAAGCRARNKTPAATSGAAQKAPALYRPRPTPKPPPQRPGQPTPRPPLPQ